MSYTKQLFEQYDWENPFNTNCHDEDYQYEMWQEKQRELEYEKYINYFEDKLNNNG